MKLLTGLTTSESFVPSIIIAIEKSIENIITGIILSLAISFIIFVGIMPIKTSLKTGISLASKDESLMNLTPEPISIKIPTKIPTTVAIAVVPKRSAIVLKPIFLSWSGLSSEVTLEIKELTTRGITSILIKLIYIPPIGSSIIAFSLNIAPNPSPNTIAIKTLFPKLIFLFFRKYKTPSSSRPTNNPIYIDIIFTS